MSDDCDTTKCAECPCECPIKEGIPDLSAITPGDEVEEPTDPTAQFDQSRDARRESINMANEVLKRVHDGAKLSRKDIIKALRGLTAETIFLDELCVTLLQEMYRIVQAIANNEVSSFTLRANLKAVVMAITRKELISEEELSKIFSDEVLPKMLPKEEPEDTTNNGDVVAEYVKPEVE